MAAISLSSSRYNLSLLLLVFYLVTLTAKPISSFSLKRFDKDANFDPQVTLLGDAHIVDGGSVVKISSDGRLVYKNPFKFVDGKNPRNPMSFSTYFEFSLSGENGGDGIAFVFVPKDSTKDGGLVVDFDAKGNPIGVEAKVHNVSSAKLVTNDGGKLHSWIDYEASSKRLEVRLRGSSNRPYDPLLSYQIDLGKMWKEEDVFVGLSSISGNSTQFASIYAWSFRLRHVPTWFHSQPLDPHESLHSSPQRVRERSVCLSRILAALIFGIGCGALTVFIVLFAKAIFASKNAAVVPAEYPVHPMEFGYEKIKIVVEKVTTDAKKVEA